MELKYDENTYKKVYFDFGSAVPTSLDSWRGVYAELALGYRLTGYDETERGSSNSNDANVLLEELRSAVGKSFDGWKGGEFTMRVDTPVWVANSGNSGNTGIVGILDKSWCIIILTQYCEA